MTKLFFFNMNETYFVCSVIRDSATQIQLSIKQINSQLLINDWTLSIEKGRTAEVWLHPLPTVIVAPLKDAVPLVDIKTYVDQLT